MSHGVHAVQHEVEHKIKHDEHGHGGGHADSCKPNKKIALLIAVIALFLAFSETLGKSAQTDGDQLPTSRPPICGPSSRPRPSAARAATPPPRR